MEVLSKSDASIEEKVEKGVYIVEMGDVSVEPVSSDSKTRDPFEPTDLRTVTSDTDFEEPILSKRDEAGKKLKLQFGEIAAIGKLKMESILQQFVDIFDFNVAREAKENS